MIRDMWYAVLRSSEVPRGRPVGVTRFGERLVFWREQTGGVACGRDLCPHRGAALSMGKVCNGLLTCPFHGFEYASDGQCRLVPSNGKAAAVPRALRLSTCPTWEGHGLIFVWWGQASAQPEQPEWFEDLDDSFAVVTTADRWRTHYSRAIENQLDAAHLPFVHHNTIGRKMGTLVDGPWVT